ncbi:MAG: class I SAM-dependent methyltransferase [Nanoarchaeota archaeon]
MAKRFHGKLGEEYELFKLACPHFDSIQRGLAKAIKTHYPTARTALEVGFGSGYTTSFVLSQNPSMHVTAIDNEDIMVKQARHNLKDSIFDGKVDLVLADALPFLSRCPPRHFDVIYSAFTLHNFDSSYRARVLAEIYRVLGKEGLFVNGDKYAFSNPNMHRKSLEWQLKQFDVYDYMGRPDIKREWTSHYLEDNQPDVVMRENEAIHLMNGIGFKDIKRIFRRHMEAILFARK